MFFGKNIQSVVKNKLQNETEGTCSERYGFIIIVTEILNISRGVIQEGIGCAKFSVKFEAIVFRPFKGEILDANVTTINKMGFFAESGPLKIFVSRHVSYLSLKQITPD